MVSYCDRSISHRLSSTIASNDILTTGWILTKLARNDSYMAPLQIGQMVLIHAYLGHTMAKNRFSR